MILFILSYYTFESIEPFSCDQLAIKCWNKVSHAECITKQNNNHIIPQAETTNQNVGYTRERLSRAFYLLESADGDFSQFTNKKEKKVYKWSYPLIETFIKKLQINGFCYPYY